jgi:(S)-2-hydroxyglutarate dehydrogenase
MNSNRYEIAIIGGGIVGMATAMSIVRRYGASLVVLETENHLAPHQTGNNSGVIHSGLYYKPGSAKARNCVEGREAMYRFCAEYGIGYDRCGKVVVAVDERELPALDELERRSLANGLKGVKRLGPEEIREHEPHVRGVAGLWVPETGIADYKGVTAKYGDLVRQGGSEVRLEAKVTAVHARPDEIVLETKQGEVHAKNLIACAGLHADRVARMCGLEPGLLIVPFRGEYYELVPERQFLVKNLIYPVPDPRFPFLGVHFTRMIRGGIEAGPNAVLALKREGYSWRAISPRDLWEMAAFKGFWRMAGKFWKMGLSEFHRSLSKHAFHRALARLIPELRIEDIHPAGAGVRAQALDASGALVDDFRFVERERMIHVLNAPSPAATASLAIGQTIAEMAGKNFGLRPITTKAVI